MRGVCAFLVVSLVRLFIYLFCSVKCGFSGFRVVKFNVSVWCVFGSVIFMSGFRLFLIGSFVGLVLFWWCPCGCSAFLIRRSGLHAV